MATHDIQIVAPTTNALNGNADPEATVSAAYQQQIDQEQQQNTTYKTTKKTTTTATTKAASPVADPSVTKGTAAPREYSHTNYAASTAVPDSSVNTRPASEQFNPMVDLWIPLGLLIVILSVVIRFMWWMTKKFPSKGGYVHVPKHPHPGKPSPKVFEHKK
jgi:hypothetical protein